MKPISVVLLASAVSVCSAACPSGPLSIAGASSIQQLTEAWKGAFEETCQDVDITIEGGGSSDGAARVCGTRANAAAVDIGAMSRDFNPVEASTENGWTYDCERSPRSVIQVCHVVLCFIECHLAVGLCITQLTHIGYFLFLRRLIHY